MCPGTSPYPVIRVGARRTKQAFRVLRKHRSIGTGVVSPGELEIPYDEEDYRLQELDVSMRWRKGITSMSDGGVCEHSVNNVAT